MGVCVPVCLCIFREDAILAPGMFHHIWSCYGLALKRHGEPHMVFGGRVAGEIVKGGGVGGRNEGRVGGRERGSE